MPASFAARQAEFCFYAAFSKVDVRLRVRVPGTVQQFTVDSARPAYLHHWQRPAPLCAARTLNAMGELTPRYHCAKRT